MTRGSHKKDFISKLNQRNWRYKKKYKIVNLLIILPGKLNGNDVHDLKFKPEM